MDTKRCAYCHKLVRADAQTCSRCGHVFVQSRPRPLPVDDAPSMPSMPSLPPASPHQAGHYAGLHPEDQPYQSSMIAIQHSPTPIATRRAMPVEPQQLILPAVPQTPTETHRRSEPKTDRVATPVRRITHAKPRRSFLLPRRAIPILLTLSVLFFLIASSILAFVLMNHHTPADGATLQAIPNQLRAGDELVLSGKGFGAGNAIAFTYDVNTPLYDQNGSPLIVHADNQGVFIVNISVPTYWAVGDHAIHATDDAQRMLISTQITIEQPSSAPPQLQLSTTKINLGANQYQSSITLNNGGGGQIAWTSHSDAAWLSVTPASGNFQGSQAVTLSVNHSGLQPQIYMGHLVFTAKDTGTSLSLTVTMQVKPAPASLNISTAALKFTASPGQLVSQSVTLQNSGGVALDWSGSAITGDGTPWLSLSPAAGTISPGSSITVLVSVQSQQLAAGQYTGTITFNGSTPVLVSLTVQAPANLVLSSSMLTATVVAGQTPVGQSVTLQNTGDLQLNWTASTTQAWLIVTPASGSIAPHGQSTISVTFATASLKPANYPAKLAFGYNDIVKQIDVGLTVTVPPAPVISVPGTPFAFSSYVGANPSSQSFTITNTGNAPLPWVASESGNGASFAPVTPASGTLAAGASATLTITPNVGGASAGTLTTTLTIADSSPGTTVASQKVLISVTVLNQANISVSSTQLAITNTATTSQTSTLLQISNTGSATLNWVATPQATAAWLSVDVASGSIAPGQSEVINVQCNSSQLVSGTYAATLIISDSDAGTPVAAQTVHVTLIVQ